MALNLKKTSSMSLTDLTPLSEDDRVVDVRVRLARAKASVETATVLAREQKAIISGTLEKSGWITTRDRAGQTHEVQVTDSRPISSRDFLTAKRDLPALEDHISEMRLEVLALEEEHEAVRTEALAARLPPVLAARRAVNRRIVTAMQALLGGAVAELRSLEAVEERLLGRPPLYDAWPELTEAALESRCAWLRQQGELSE